MHLKGLHSYNYPEVTNILLGQVQWTMMSHNSDITTLTYHARSLSADVLFADIAITAFEDGPAGDTSDTYITAPGHKFKDGDTVEIDNTTNYDGTVTISDLAGDRFSITTNYVAEVPAIPAPTVTLKDTAAHIYVPDADAWCAIKVVSWDNVGQLLGGSFQARSINGFPGDDFSQTGNYTGLYTNNYNLVAGDMITGIYDKVAVSATSVGHNTYLQSFKIKL